MAAVTVTLIYWLVIRFTGNAPLFSCHSISNEYNVPVYKKGQYTKKVLSMCLTHPISAIYHKSIIFRFLSVVNNNVLSSHLLIWWNNRPWFLPQTADSLRSPDVSKFSVTKGKLAVLSALCRACECRGLITRGQIRPAETKRFSDVRDESMKSPDFFVFKLLYVSAPPVVSNYIWMLDKAVDCYIYP